MPAVHILQGIPERYELLIRRTARGRGRLTWTVPSRAQAGDIAVFYLSSPVSAFVAYGTINEDAWRESNPRDPWFGRYFAEVREVRPLPRDVSLAEMRARFPVAAVQCRPADAHMLTSLIWRGLQRKFWRFGERAANGFVA